MDFSEKLYTLRKRRKMSQEDLAQVLGVSRQAVQKWEAATASPDKNNLIALSHFFEISLDVLLKNELSLEGSTPKESETSKPSTSTVPQYNPYWGGYHYKSEKTLLGLPLVHINCGPGFRLARGIIAIGNYAIGFITIGGLSLGLLSLGGICLGLLLSLGGVVFGGITIGGVSVGVIACGGVARGMLVAVGGVASGAYAAGGVAQASKIAIGHVAKGYLALGEELKGIVEITTEQLRALSHTDIEAIILREYPGLWKPFVSLLASIALWIK